MTEPETSPPLAERIEVFGERILRMPGPVGFTGRLLGAWLSRFLAVQGFDRGVAIGAQTFSAMLPLLIMISAVRSGADTTAAEFVDLLELQGAAAQSTLQAFAPINDADSTISWVGGVLLVGSVLSLSRAVQRLYEQALGLRPLGFKTTGYGLLWACVVVLGVVIGDVAYDETGRGVRLLAVLVIATAVALLTPYLLLMRRLAWQRLIWSAVMTAFGMLFFVWVSSVWMSRTVEEWATRFGVMGVAFAILSWTTGAAFLLVVGACGGAVLDEARDEPDEIADRLMAELHGKRELKR